MFTKFEEMPKIKLPYGVADPKLSDSTMRDGAQMAGVVMKKAHKLQIFEFLHEIGIEKTEVFLYNERDKIVAREMLKRGYEKPQVTGWARANPKDIDLVLAMDGIKETGVLLSTSDIHIIHKLGLNREEANKRYLNAVQYATDHGLKVRCHLEDVTRSDIEGFTIPLIKGILEIAPDAIVRICDTLNFGIPFPEADFPFGIPKLIKRLKEIGVKEVETHVHDDFGLSVANSLSGYWYGADWSNLTFLGIGERAGNAELEKVLIFLCTRVEGFQKYDLSCLVRFAEFMEAEVGYRVPRNKSVVGRNIFAHESGIHTAGVIKYPFTYEPFPPELVGGTRRLMIGDSSGTEVVKLKVEEALEELMGVKIQVDKNDPRIKEIHKEIHKLYDDEQRVSCISDEEIRAYVAKYFMLETLIQREIDIIPENEKNNERK